MKQLINTVLRRAGVQLVRTETLDRLRSEVIELREARPFLENVYGHKMFVDHTDEGLKLSQLVGRPPEAPEDGFFMRHIRSGQTVLDLGANVGLYTLLFAKLVGPTGTVLAVEPGPKSFSLLTKNVNANGYANVELENAAVTDHSGMIDLFVCPTGESDNRLQGTIAEGNSWEKVTVPCFAVDDFLKGRSVDLIKMDIQGSEFPALRGMRKTLESNPSIKVALEFSPELFDDKPAFFKLVRDVGLSFFDMNERPLTPDRLLSVVGNAGQPAHINIVLSR